MFQFEPAFQTMPTCAPPPAPPLLHPHVVYISVDGCTVASGGLSRLHPHIPCSFVVHSTSQPCVAFVYPLSSGDSLSLTMECCFSWLSDQGTPSSTPNDVSLACSYASVIMWLSCDIIHTRTYECHLLCQLLSRMKWWLELVLHFASVSCVVWPLYMHAQE